jgi:pseudaminic acid synthase
MTAAIDIGGRRIGPGEPVYVVAELSANHKGDLDRAIAIIHAAATAGADAVKLQTYTPDTLTIDCDNDCFRIAGKGVWAGRTLYELYGEACTPWAWHPRLAEAAANAGLALFSTPFDETAVDYLEEMAVPAHKIASFELNDTQLLRAVASTGKPVIASTGMASLAEIDEAVSTLRGAGCEQLALLKCTSAYPAPPSEMNLRAIPRLAERFGLPAGLSDHTLGDTVAVASVALGACIIEKHLTLSRDDGGPDAAFSAEPDELERLVHAVREAESALGSGELQSTPGEAALRELRRSLFVVANIGAGEQITRENVRSIRPGHGLAPRHLEEVLGKRAARDIRRGTPLDWDLLEP